MTAPKEGVGGEPEAFLLRVPRCGELIVAYRWPASIGAQHGTHRWVPVSLTDGSARLRRHDAVEMACVLLVSTDVLVLDVAAARSLLVTPADELLVSSG